MDRLRGSFWLGMAVSVASLVAIFIIINPVEILEALRSTRLDYLGLCILGVLAFMFIRAARWRFMLNNEVTFPQVFHIQNIGYMLTNILPLRIGDLARAVLIGNIPPVTIARGVSTMLVERVLDMIFMITLLPFTLAGLETLPEWLRSAARASSIIAVLAMGVLILAANRRPLVERITGSALQRVSFLDQKLWAKRVDDLLLGLNSLTRPRDGFILALYSVVTWLPIIGAYYAMLRAVNLEPTWVMAAFVVCAAAFSIAAPSSPGGVGVFHAGVIAALAFLGQPQAQSASFAFVYQALNVLIMVFLGILGLAATGSTFGQVVASARQVSQSRE